MWPGKAFFWRQTAKSFNLATKLSPELLCWKKSIFKVQPSLRWFLRTKSSGTIVFYITTKSMRALWLVNHLWVIMPVNPRKDRASSEFLYKSNRPQGSMGYRLINHLKCCRTLEEFVMSVVSPTSRFAYIEVVSHTRPSRFAYTLWVDSPTFKSIRLHM